MSCKVISICLLLKCQPKNDNHFVIQLSPISFPDYCKTWSSFYNRLISICSFISWSLLHFLRVISLDFTNSLSFLINCFLQLLSTLLFLISLLLYCPILFWLNLFIFVLLISLLLLFFFYLLLFLLIDNLSLFIWVKWFLLTMWEIKSGPSKDWIRR